MTIDERLEAVTMNLQLAGREIRRTARGSSDRRREHPRAGVHCRAATLWDRRAQRLAVAATKPKPLQRYFNRGGLQKRTVGLRHRALDAGFHQRAGYVARDLQRLCNRTAL